MASHLEIIRSLLDSPVEEMRDRLRAILAQVEMHLEDSVQEEILDYIQFAVVIDYVLGQIIASLQAERPVGLNSFTAHGSDILNQFDTLAANLQDCVEVCLRDMMPRLANDITMSSVSSAVVEIAQRKRISLSVGQRLANGFATATHFITRFFAVLSIVVPLEQRNAASMRLIAQNSYAVIGNLAMSQLGKVIRAEDLLAKPHLSRSPSVICRDMEPSAFYFDSEKMRVGIKLEYINSISSHAPKPLHHKTCPAHMAIERHIAVRSWYDYVLSLASEIYQNKYPDAANVALQ